MPVFSYIAHERGRREHAGTITADTPRQARDLLRARGLVVQKVAASEAASAARAALPWRRVPTAAVSGLYRELATLLGVGIPLLEALATLARQHHGPMKTAIEIICDRIAAGSTLAEAMADHPRLFDDVAISIVAVGERAGTLDESLQRIAQFKERAAQLRGSLVGALLYPAVVLAMGVLVSAFLMTYVVPNLLQVLVETGRELPAATRIIKALSDLLVERWWLLLSGGLAVTLVAAQAARRPGLQRIWHAWQLTLPIVGPLVLKQAIGRIAMVMATLLRSGVPFVQAVRIARDGTGNRLLRDALDRCEQAVVAGRDLDEALGATGVLPPMVVQVFGVGQQSGQLEDMLDRLTIDYDQQVQTATHRLTTLLEPLIIVVLALVVGFIAFATVLPILEAGDVL